MKRIAGIILAALISAAAAAQSSSGNLSTDGPYLFCNSNGSCRTICINADGSISDTISQDKPASVTVTDHSGTISFEVPLHEVSRPEWEYEQPERVFVMSDPHGNLACVLSLLKGAGIIDENLNWAFGKGHLVILGDVFDRGEDVTQILWLIYKLEDEARKAGGNLSFQYGNHEPMFLRGDFRYTEPKYMELANALKMPLQDLYAPNTVLGQWLDTRNTIQMIGKDLYVHAGIGADFLKLGLSIPEANSLMSEGLRYSTEQRRAYSDKMYELHTTYGPVWHRGLVLKAEKYHPDSMAQVDSVLQAFGAEHIFVGHTIFDEVRTFYGGKVIAVNVDNKEAMESGLGRGVMIENGSYTIYGDSGAIRPLAESDPSRFDYAHRKCNELAAKFAKTAAETATGDLIVAIAKEFLETPYVGGTLETEPEQLSIYMDKTDCILFVEMCTNLALTLKGIRIEQACDGEHFALRSEPSVSSEEPSYELFFHNVRQMRYRRGIVDGYASRIHYTSEWLLQNETNGIVREFTPEIGRKFTQKFSFMTEHVGNYKQLQNAPADVAKIAAVEKRLEAQKPYWFISQKQLQDPSVQAQIKDGDIVTFISKAKGLDLAHVAIACWDKGELHFIHASYGAKKVILEPKTLADYATNGIRISRVTVE